MWFQCLPLLLLSSSLYAEGTAEVDPASTESKQKDVAPSSQKSGPIVSLPTELNHSWQQGIKNSQELVTISSSAQVSFQAIYRQSSIKRLDGGVILIHDRNEHPDWSGVTRYLGESLTRYGWNTLSIPWPDLSTEVDKNSVGSKDLEVPSPESGIEGAESDTAIESEKEVPPAAPDTDAKDKKEPLTEESGEPPLNPISDAKTNTSPSATKEKQSEYQSIRQQTLLTPSDALLKAHFESAINFMKEKSLFNLVMIGHGEGAELIVRHLGKNGAEGIQGVVVVGLGAASVKEDAGSDVEHNLRQLDLYILDIYGSRDRAAKASAQKRKGLISGPVVDQKSKHRVASEFARAYSRKLNRQITYRQVEIPGGDRQLYGQLPSLGKRIAGWLRQHTAGQIREQGN